MDLLIFNRDLDYLGIIDTYSSLRWVRRYNKSGEFELNCPLTQHSLELLKRENIIYKKEDNEAGYIETRQLKVDINGQEFLEIKGKFLTNYLDRRINWGQVIFNGKVEDLMRNLVLDNAINPSNVNRKIPNLALGDLKGFTEKLDYQNSYGNILEQLENISNTNNLGYRILFNYKTKN